MAFKLSLVADVRQWLKGTTDVEKSLDDLADSLDDLAKDTKTNADDAADSLSREFSDAFDKVKTEARTTGRHVGDAMDDGTRRAGDGLDNLKDEANQTAREAAASFDGSAESILDMFQEVSAQAFAGFGPAGAAAGLAAALGIGAAYNALQNTADKANDSRQAVVDLAKALHEVKGNQAALQWAGLLEEKLLEIVNKKEWFEFWEADNAPSTRLQEWSEKAQRYGVDMSDVTRMLMGDQAAQVSVVEDLNRAYEDQARAYQDGDSAAAQAMGTIQAWKAELEGQAGAVEDAAALNRLYEESVSGVADAQDDAARATEEFASASAEYLDEAASNWESYVSDHGFKLEEYIKDNKDAAKKVREAVQDLVDIAPEISPEAFAYLKSLGPEAAAALVSGYKSGTKAQKGELNSIWTEAGKASSDGYQEGADLASATKKKVEEAQAVADKNKIEYRTKLDASNLQSDVNRAAAGINPPTIYVDVQVRKTTP